MSHPDDRLHSAGMLRAYHDGQVSGRSGVRFPSIVWPRDGQEDDARMHLQSFARDEWMHLQNIARAYAGGRASVMGPEGARVKVYGYMGLDGWQYTIGDEMCRCFAHRPGLHEEPDDEQEVPDTADEHDYDAEAWFGLGEN